MKKLILLPIIILLVLGVVLSGCAKPAPAPTPAPAPAPPPAAKVTELKIQSAWPRGDLSMETLAAFAAAAEKRSNGQLKISVFAAPEIVGMFEVPDAVKKGTIDLAMGSGGLWGGVIPVGDPEFGLPYGYRIPEDHSFKGSANIIRKFFFQGGFIDLLRTEYAKQGVYYLDIHSYGPVPFIVATKPVQTLKDIKGLRMRTDGLWMVWQNAMGMNGVDLPGDEAYMGLKLGTIDADTWDVSVITGMKVHEVAPYWIRGMEGDHAIGHILVNMDVWNKLSADLKKVLEGAAEDYWNVMLDNYDRDLNSIQDMVKKGTIKEVQMDKDVIALAEQTAYKIWDEVAARDAASAKAVDMIKKWRGVK